MWNTKSGWIHLSSYQSKVSKKITIITTEIHKHNEAKDQQLLAHSN